jgi:DNA-binding SARP family transcriptional activator
MTGDQELHLKLVNEGLEMSQTSGIYTWDHMLFSAGAVSCLDKGDLAGAGEFLRRMEPLIASRPRSAFSYRFTAAQYYALLGELRHAVEHARIAQKLIVEIGYPFYEALSRLQMAELLHQTGENQKASEQLKIAGEIVNQMGSLILGYMYWMAKAQFTLDNGEEDSGLTSLRKAMELGREQGYVRTYSSWQPPVMARLCAKALAEGIEVEYVQNLIRKLELLPDPLPVEIDNWPWPLKIYTLGQFALERDGEPIRFYGKVQHKPLAMLKAMIAPGGKDQEEEQISDLLWPEADGDAAHSTFKSNLFRLRQLLEVENAVKFQEGKAGLDPRYCWVDAWAFERIFDKVEAALKGKGETRRDGKYETGNRGIGEEEIMQLAGKAIGLYKGHFLPGDEEETWTVSYRERLRSKFLRLITKLGDSLQKTGQWEKALEYYQKGLQVDDLAEEFYQGLMICHQRLGAISDAVKTYRNCQKILSAVLGVEPSPLTQRIYKETTTKRRNGESGKRSTAKG